MVLKDQLTELRIRPTYQRIKILEYLHENHTHPTVEEIYSSLSPEIPTLSKTTVYNTLKTLSENRIVDEIKIQDNETRYDILTKPHGHFKCLHCGKIYNFDIDMEAIAPKELIEFDIESKTINFTGICPNCK